MDPSILKTTSESEEDQTVDRKVSAPLDPSTLHISERRRGDTHNSCFDLNMATIQALQAKADKAMGKDLSQKEENKYENESDSEDEYHNEYSDKDDNCTDNANENDISTSECNSTKQMFSNNQRPRANTVCGASPSSESSSQRAVRKTSQILINVGNTSTNDFKPVSFTFNTEEMQRNMRQSRQTTPARSENQLNSNNNHEFSSEFSLKQEHNHITEQQRLTSQMDESILENGHPEENKLPKICVNDELISTSPSPVSVKLNNIEKLDSEGLIGRTTSPQASSSLNIADVSKITESVQSITVKLDNLNGVQFTPGNVTCSVRRSSTGSAPC